jgi:hypothetical protein
MSVEITEEARQNAKLCLMDAGAARERGRIAPESLLRALAAWAAAEIEMLAAAHGLVVRSGLAVRDRNCCPGGGDVVSTTGDSAELAVRRMVQDVAEMLFMVARPNWLFSWRVRPEIDIQGSYVATFESYARINVVSPDVFASDFRILRP